MWNVHETSSLQKTYLCAAPFVRLTAYFLHLFIYFYFFSEHVEPRAAAGSQGPHRSAGGVRTHKSAVRPSVDAGGTSQSEWENSLLRILEKFNPCLIDWFALKSDSSDIGEVCVCEGSGTAPVDHCKTRCKMFRLWVHRDKAAMDGPPAFQPGEIPHLYNYSKGNETRPRAQTHSLIPRWRHTCDFVDKLKKKREILPARMTHGDADENVTKKTHPNRLMCLIQMRGTKDCLQIAGSGGPKFTSGYLDPVESWEMTMQALLQKRHYQPIFPKVSDPLPLTRKPIRY